MHASSSPTTTNLPKRELLKDKSAMVSWHLQVVCAICNCSASTGSPILKMPKDFGSRFCRPKARNPYLRRLSSNKAIGEEIRIGQCVVSSNSIVSGAGLQQASGPMNHCSAWEDVIGGSLEKPCHAPSVRRNWHPAFPNFPEHNLHSIIHHTISYHIQGASASTTLSYYVRMFCGCVVGGSRMHTNYANQSQLGGWWCMIPLHIHQRCIWFSKPHHV